MAITDFSKENEFLSNFYSCTIIYEDITYHTTEAAYQAAKTFDVLDKKGIAVAATPGLAKKLGRRLKMRTDWDEVKISVMEQCLRLKFAQPELKKKLLDTGEEYLVEGNHWGDIFWGVCKGKGENNLGILLMKLREEYKNSLQSS